MVIILCVTYISHYSNHYTTLHYIMYTLHATIKQYYVNTCLVSSIKCALNEGLCVNYQIVHQETVSAVSVVE